MKLVNKIGRPALENDQPEILKVICELAKQGAGADGRRRCEALNSSTNAPGRSAYNAIERRMAPLSRQLSGLVLPHDHFGNHLDSSGKTVDVEKEKKNFEAATNVLAEVWNATVIDDYPVVAKYQAPEK
ncbi:hypothetical protein JTE90_007061 [Oedothorax gibbosus]|uniref:Uncharacterized protein n=1 Tax=Oedothorax gibbosus TaxID=931172 RepID=A0AAV6U3H0_9ARAC|nr:hypothetical protein JTE90_007061 [Oedothorax gibbosus]